MRERLFQNYLHFCKEVANSPQKVHLNLYIYLHVLFCIFQVYVLQDTELMKFVFNRDPTTVQRKLPEFKSQLEGAFAQPYKFNIYDTEFYSKVDGSLDFGRTRYEIKSTRYIISGKYRYTQTSI